MFMIQLAVDMCVVSKAGGHFAFACSASVTSQRLPWFERICSVQNARRIFFDFGRWWFGGSPHLWSKNLLQAQDLQKAKQSRTSGCCSSTTCRSTPPSTATCVSGPIHLIWCGWRLVRHNFGSLTAVQIGAGLTGVRFFMRELQVVQHGV